MYKKYKKAFWLALLVSGVQQITGINAVTFYAPIIFEKQPNSSFLPPAMTFTRLAFAFFVIPIAGKFGRRTLLLWGVVISTITHLTCFISLDPSGKDEVMNWIFNVGLFIYVGTFNLTYGPIG